MKHIRSVLITGASSGIGAALATEYASAGISLALFGRNAGRLAAVAEHCRKKGADVISHIVDVTDQDAMEKLIVSADSRRPLDLVIANAGISGGTGSHDDNGAIARAIFAVNVGGTLNTVSPTIALMRKRRAGHIAIMSSLAAFRGLSTAPAYSASKAALKSYGDGLRGRLAPDGIFVSVICPGWVKSPLSDANQYRTPLLLSAEAAARTIRRGLEAHRTLIAFPWPAYAAARLLAMLPSRLYDWIVRCAPRKNRDAG